uniref:Uncharacterized protein n=1 Tax=Lepeophtheirus salmonis TaxID=72036 RepID=A0A0K2TEK8_LEPSM
MMKHFILNGQTKTFFTNPFKCNSRIHVMFDMAHNLKNIRNNFERKTIFICPPFEEGESTFKPSYNYIKKLH